MYRLLKTKRAFTIVELMIVVLLLGILTAVAIPLAGSVIKNQKTKDCKNQIVIIEGHVKTVMSGMEDNGKSIKTMSIEEGVFHGAEGERYWIISSEYSPTLGNMRGDSLKKQRLKDVLFSTLFTFSEVPVCPFDKEGTAGYRIYSDGHVECNCADCPNYKGD